MNSDISPNKPCNLLWLGVTDYAQGLELQREAARRRAEDSLSDILILLQHPHTYTLGRGAGESDVLLEAEDLERIGARVYHVDRGGEATYHGPGQLVGYPIVDVRPLGGARGYVRALESLLIDSLADFGIEAERRDGQPGAWVGDEKIAFIGVRISRGITTHGFALNVDPDLSYFRHVVPCGMEGLVVTSMTRVLGRPVSVDDVTTTLARRFGRLFRREMVEVGPGELREYSSVIPEEAGI